MDLSKYKNIVILRQKDTEEMSLYRYRELIMKSDLILADQGESNFNKDIHEYRVMKNRRGHIRDNVYIHISDIAKILLKSEN
jgi:hypothetical protein